MNSFNTTLVQSTTSITSSVIALFPPPLGIDSQPQVDFRHKHTFQFDPWSIFSALWSVVLGYAAEDFRFIPGHTTLSTVGQATFFIACYYLVIFGGRELMHDRPPLQLRRAFIVHNWYLTVISGGLLILFLQQLIPSLWRKGLYDNICGSSGWTKQLVVLYYLNYLTKYLELLDTVFLVLKKKPLTFLHTYHHGATALLCYTQLVGQTSVSWVPITLNLTVHVVMYWYYYQSARGNRVWWKQYITMLQITQFVLDLGVIYFACWNYYASTYAPFLPHYGTCGDPKQEIAAFAGCAIISSYLVLFIAFYFSTYKRPSARTVLKPASKGDLTRLEVTKGRIRSASVCFAEKLASETVPCSIEKTALL